MVLLSQIKLLITLAKIDGEFAETERQYIENIARANGFSEKQLNRLMDESYEMIVPGDLDNHTKFNYIFSLIQLMKIDEKLYNEEIKYCAKVAAKLGYKEDVLFEMMLNVRSTAMSDDEVDSLRALTEKYLGHH